MKIRFIIKEQVAQNTQDLQNKLNDAMTAAIQNLDTVSDPVAAQNLIDQALQLLNQAAGTAPISEKKKKDAVSKKISTLRDEGKPQKQAVAIALDMERRGKLKEEEGDWFDRLIKWLTGTKAGNTVLDTANRRRGENQVSSAYKGKK